MLLLSLRQCYDAQLFGNRRDSEAVIRNWAEREPEVLERVQSLLLTDTGQLV